MLGSLLGRLRIRAKLALVVALPLVAVALMTVPAVTGALDRAQRAEQIGDSMVLAGQMTSLVSELRQERLMAIGYLFGVVDRGRLVDQATRVADRAADIRYDAADGDLADSVMTDRVRAALDGVDGLSGLRGAVEQRQASPEQIMVGFGGVVQELIDSMNLLDGLDLATPAARQVVALDAALRVNEVTSQSLGQLLLFAATENVEVLGQYLITLRLLDDHVARFVQYATPEQLAMMQLMEDAYEAREATGLGAGFAPELVAEAPELSAALVYPSIESISQLGRFVETKVITDVVLEVADQGRSETRSAYLAALGAILLVAMVVGLTLLLARAVVRPLIGLTRSANRVAEVADSELARIADEEGESAEPIRLDPVLVNARDEIGDLSRAFDRVQGTAVQLVERQVASRRNVALMLGYLGRRTHNLVGRQLDLIDRMEREEVDSGRLTQLYRLDHMSSRLRRNASSLVVLSGATGTDEHVAPLPLSDVARLALGEIENYDRVDVAVPATISVVPAVIGDLVLVLAELMENATTFSPPHTRVAVAAAPVGDGVEVTVTDRGIGMAPERIAEENSRFTRRERLDLAPSEVLGLFVVGRLARRHGLQVVLSPTAGGGLTATITIGRALLVGPPPEAPTLPPAPAEPPTESPTARPGTLMELVWPRVDSGFIDAAVLSRASHTLAAGRSWDAFALTRTMGPPPAESPATGPPPTGTPATEPPAGREPDGDEPNGDQPSSDQGGGTEPGGDEPATAQPVGDADGEPTQPDAPVTGDGSRGLATLTAPSGPGSTGQPSTPRVTRLSNLRRRVPGATLDPAPPVSAEQGSRRVVSDPDGARDLVEQLQSGVARALREMRADTGTEEREEHDDR